MGQICGSNKKSSMALEDQDHVELIAEPKSTYIPEDKVANLTFFIVDL